MIEYLPDTKNYSYKRQKDSVDLSDDSAIVFSLLTSLFPG